MKEFFANKIDYEKVHNSVDTLKTTHTLAELMFIFREIAYYTVSAESDLYKQDREELNIEQANQLQSQIRALADLFNQSVSRRRVFEPSYFEEYRFARPYIYQLERLKNNDY